MMIKDTSLRQDPDLRKELALLARGCDLVFPSRFKKRLKAFQQVQVQAKKENLLPPTLSECIPKFYFPQGCPKKTLNVDAVIARIENVFTQFENEKATLEDMGKIAKVCECPLYWKAPLFCAAGGERTGYISVHKFVATWRKILQNCHDDASKFLHLLSKPGCNYLEQEDFIPLIQDVVNTHPGLTFLREATEFHTRYVTTVIQRIFYTVNRSWTGRITCTEIRKSNLLQNLALLEEEDDINQLTEFFSYEHFYVIYCKFWELDTDHDLYIDQKDLARHNDDAISSRMIERIFSGAVTRHRNATKERKIGYADFVWFLISEEDKKTSTSIEYWFRCLDLDGDGVLSMYELNYFYEEQCKKLECMSIEPLPFEDCLCQLLDLVKPECEGKITLHDLKKCKMANIFFDTLFNIDKYLEHEQKDPFSIQRQDVENDGPEMTDWERYAVNEYENLVAEEAANENWNDGSNRYIGDPDGPNGFADSPFSRANRLGSRVAQRRSDEAQDGGRPHLSERQGEPARGKMVGTNDQVVHMLVFGFPNSSFLDKSKGSASKDSELSDY
ncbi:serine/threonine-protein phosphatase 2A regulatory subunit B'' subunit beta [Pristis pectinata]|uniref:serine/threonine-protein phosphatase 2A regulatory subunit B'' subunit beta n=1 Tax=Pristis pectinata TaxID=685728 RepID=UPI00223DDBCA|nr:serine/threonine-protein phosphatase 2A regulatory subunit B'' subunit beta [Pristis pectinata]